MDCRLTTVETSSMMAETPSIPVTYQCHHSRVLVKAMSNRLWGLCEAAFAVCRLRKCSNRSRLISTAPLTEWCNYVAAVPRQNTDDAIEHTVQIFRQHPLSESVLHEKKIATMQELGEGGARAVFTQAATTDDL